MTRAALLRARLLHAAARMGTVGWAGLAALLLALALAAAARLQVDPSSRDAAGELEQLRAQLLKAAAPGAALRSADALEAVVAQMPSPEQAPVFIQDVQGAAARGGVRIERTEYRMQSALGRRALQLQLVMPAHGTYPQLRTWVQELLHRYPSAALDELSLRRESDGAPLLEAHVALSFYSQAVR